MNWNNLKQNKCPKCGSLLKEHRHLVTRQKFMKCRGTCEFIIDLFKFESIVNDLYKPKRQRRGSYEDNLFELNNM